jgi:hypothetical protein
MKTRMLWLLCCMLALSSQAQTTGREVWVWRDANGVTHFSDKPEPGARRMIVAGSPPAATQQTTTTPSASAGEGSVRGEGTAGSAAAQYVRYESLEIVSPTDQETIFSAEGSVPVQIASRPELAAGDRLVVYLNGKPANAPENTYALTISGVERGQHTLTATILDSQGNPKIDSAPRTFFMRQNTIDNPRNVGPALRPRPTPLPAPAASPPPRPSGK